MPAAQSSVGGKVANQMELPLTILLGGRVMAQHRRTIIAPTHEVARTSSRLSSHGPGVHCPWHRRVPDARTQRHVVAFTDRLRDPPRPAPLFTDRFSFTAYGNFFWNHSWLAQAVFYLLYSVGGFPLLTAFCATLTLAAWALVWRQMQGPLDMRLVLFAVACAGATTIWSVRPQVFSIVMLPLVAILVARDRWWLIPPAIALWANLHAGVAMGLVVVGASVAAALLDRERLLPRAACVAASVVATLATPLGVRSWTELVASVGRSRANRIQEWQPTALPPDQMLFWALAAVFVWQLTRHWRRLPDREDRVLAVAAMLALPIAVRSLRNRTGLPDVGCTGIDSTDLRDGARGGGSPTSRSRIRPQAPGFRSRPPSPR